MSRVTVPDQPSDCVTACPPKATHEDEKKKQVLKMSGGWQLQERGQGDGVTAWTV